MPVRQGVVGLLCGGHPPRHSLAGPRSLYHGLQTQPRGVYHTALLARCHHRALRLREFTLQRLFLHCSEPGLHSRTCCWLHCTSAKCRCSSWSLMKSSLPAGPRRVRSSAGSPPIASTQSGEFEGAAGTQMCEQVARLTIFRPDQQCMRARQPRRESPILLAWLDVYAGIFCSNSLRRVSRCNEEQAANNPSSVAALTDNHSVCGGDNVLQRTAFCKHLLRSSAGKLATRSHTHCPRTGGAGCPGAGACITYSGKTTCDGL